MASYTDAFDDQRDSESGAVRPKKARRWGQSCTECRRRKKGCEGRDKDGNSLCSYCPTFGLECIFQKPTEGSQVKELEGKISRLQDFIKSLADASPDQQKAKLSAWLSDPKSLHAVMAPRRRRTKDEESAPSPTTSAGAYSPSLATATPPIFDTPMTMPSRSDAGATARMSALLDAAGFDLARTALMTDRPSIATSSPLHDPHAHVNPRDPGMYFDEHWPREGLPALSKPISYEAAREMLDLYFCWWNHRWNNIIDQQTFEQSMERGDNIYCTPFLLTAICSVVAPHSFLSSDRQDEFGARAHFLFGQELYTAKPRITSVQAILCLAAYAADKTRHSQAYNFVGFALRMLDELSFDNEATLSPFERDTRARCTWFCFGCDKLVSLTQSRPPRHPVHLLPPLPEINPAIDQEPWVAVRHLSASERHRAPLEQAQPSMQSSFARYWCEAQLFFDEVLQQLYARGLDNVAESRAFVTSMRERFTEWQRNLPRSCFLRLDSFPEISPPAHIIYLNLMIRVIGLLLYKPLMARPDIDVPGIEEDCSRLAEETHMLFRVYDTAFPPALSTLNVLHVFAAFSAAHIDVLRLHDEQTTPREQQNLVRRISFTAGLMSEGARFPVGLPLAKLREQQAAALGDTRGHYDPIRDHYIDPASAYLPPHSAAMQPPVAGPTMLHPHYGHIDFSSLSEDMFAEAVSWPHLQQDEEVSRVLRELQQFAATNGPEYAPEGERAPGVY